MKSCIKKILAAGLALMMLVPPLPVFASEALGHDLIASDTGLSSATALGAGTFWSDTYSDFREENYIVYTPNSLVTPVVSCGETTRSLSTVLSAAQLLESSGYRVIAGINGDYYGVAHGVPLGSTMVDGVLRNANSDPYYAVGFRADGSAIIGDPGLSIQAKGADGEPFRIFAAHHVRQSGFGIFLYDHNFNVRHTTGTSEEGLDLVCSLVEGRLSIGESMTLRVEEALPGASDTPVAEGRYVLSVNYSAGESYVNQLSGFVPGDELTVSVSAVSDAWNDVVQMVGAPELLVENGTVNASLTPGQAPRTAIGQRPDGTLIFYTIDGRQSGYSVGASLEQVAMRLVELGCVKAVALDGGGSTTLCATLPDQGAAGVINKPSDGVLRAVSNHVFLVAPNTPSGVPDHIYLAPEAVRALPGAKLKISATAIDTNYIPMQTEISLSADGGTLSDGVLTLPDTPGTVTVSAYCAGAPVSSVEIEALSPEWIVLRSGGVPVESLTISQGGSAALTAEGYYLRLPLPGGTDCFTWTLSEGLGEIHDGVLTASGEPGEGVLTVSAGECSLSIPVTVPAGAPKLLDGFEDPQLSFVLSPNGSAALFRDTLESHVRFGRAAARIDYLNPDPEGTPDSVPVLYPLPAGFDTLSVWVYGDESGVSLCVDYDDHAASSEFPIDFSGWKRLTADIPAGAQAITGLRVKAPGGSGSLLLDQLVVSFNDLNDTVPPAVTLSLDSSGAAVSGTALDNLEGALLTRFEVTCDGEAVEAELDPNTGVFHAAVPADDGLAHRVTATAGDACGNLARASLTIPASEDAAPAFSDTEGHWANGYIEYLKRAGIINSAMERYQPDANVTRLEFALMLYRHLAPQEDYSYIQLPFDDLDQIDPRALDAAKALYALGVVIGSLDADGRLLFNPSAGLSRQEAMTMVDRVLDKGYSAPPLTYLDSDSIPAWSAQHIQILSGLGVLGGFEDGTFRPTLPLTRAQIAAVLFRLN